MIITAIIAVFGKLLVSGRPRYIIERRPDTTPHARSFARARNACACITAQTKAAQTVLSCAHRIHAHIRTCTLATTVSLSLSHTLRVRRRATLTLPYGNTAIYPAEVYTRVAAVNSRPGTGNVIVRDPIA